MPFGLGGAWPLQFRNFIVRHLEGLFILLVMAIVGAVFYLFPYKIAFLNFFLSPRFIGCLLPGQTQSRDGCRYFASCQAYCLLSTGQGDFAVQGTRINALLVLGDLGRVSNSGERLNWIAAREDLPKGFEETRQLYEELKRSRVTEEMKEKVEKALYATMDPVVAKLATEGKLRFEKREISIMFTDLTNFTAYSDRNRADVVLEELNRFLGQIEPIVDLFRGHIDKYMGDGDHGGIRCAGGLRPSCPPGGFSRAQDAEQPSRN